MKKILSLILALLAIATTAGAQVEINSTNFPDEIFRNIVSVNYDTDSDGFLSDEEIAAVKLTNYGTGYPLMNKGITSLKGIEYFTALITLSCHQNQLTELDISKNTELTRLECYRNQIKGAEMDALIESLKTLAENGRTGTVWIFEKSNPNEGNVVTWYQIDALSDFGRISNPWTANFIDWTNATSGPYEGSDIEINAENFPDAAFRNFVSTNYDTDNSGTLSKAEATAVTEMDVRHKNIANLKGIEFFTALETLDCSHNLLTSLDVSKNTALTMLHCVNNQLTSLDVSKNTALIQLFCYINQLTSLDVSKNTALTTLSCYDNQLTSLDVSGFTALTTLSCNNNQLTSLNVSGCTALETLSCYNNQLTSLNVSGCTALYVLHCHDNQLTSLDVSGCTALERLYCENNQLTSLYVSKSTTLWRLSCYGNQIKGDKMQALVESLPTMLNTGLFDVIDTKNKNEKNVITKSQVAIAKGKKWRVRDWNGDSVVEYEGSDDPIQQATWTVVQIDNAVKTEMVVARNGANDTVNCTAPFTTQTIDPENLTKVTLRVATTGGASEYSVYLVNYASDKKTAVIKTVMNVTGLGLAESKALVNSADGTAPVLVKTFATAAEAQAAKEALEAEGATVQVEDDGTPTRVFRDGVDVTEQGLVDSGFLCFEVSPDNLANTTWVITAEPVMPNPFDVNGDGVINPQDALKVIEKYMDQ